MMRPVFNPRLYHDGKRAEKRDVWVLVGIVSGTLILASLLVIFRHAIGRTLSLVLGMALTDLVGILIAFYIRNQMIPRHRLLTFLDRYQAKAERDLTGEVIAVKTDGLTLEYLSFVVMVVRVIESGQIHLSEVYLWASSDLPLPTVGSTVNFRLKGSYAVEVDV